MIALPKRQVVNLHIEGFCRVTPPKPLSKTIGLGQRMRAARIARRKSLPKLAAETGINQTTLWRIEKGSHKKPRTETVECVASALRVSAQWLLFGGHNAEDGPLPDPQQERVIANDSGERFIRESMVPFTVAQLLAEGRHRPVSDDEILALVRTMETNDYNLTRDALEIELLTRRARLNGNEPEYIKAITDAYARQRAERGERAVNLDTDPPPRAPLPAQRKSPSRSR